MGAIEDLALLPGFVHGRPASARDIARLEKRLGVRLPEAYCRFLKTWGWAWLEQGGNTIYGLPRKGDPSIGDDAGCAEATERERDPGPYTYPRGRLAPDGIVVEDDGGGGICVLKAVGAKDAGQVIWFDPEGEIQRWADLEGYLKDYLDCYLKRM